MIPIKAQLTRSMRLAAVCLIIVVLLLIAVIVFMLRSDNKPGLTLDEAKQVVLDQYGGQIIHAELDGHAYQIRLKSQAGLYDLQVDKDYAGITAINLIERYGGSGGNGGESIADGADAGIDPDTGTDMNTDSETNDPLTSPDSDTTASDDASNPAVQLTRKAAAKLALSKVDGIVTDVDLEKTQGKWHYFVEIDTADGREADVQINAASGTIVSVTWEDD